MIYLFLAEGYEECEALIPLDILRRANIEVKTVGVGKSTIKSSHRIQLNCDTTTDNLSFENLQGIILPGGMPGTLNLEKSDAVQAAIDYCNNNNLLIAAICAAPLILGHKNLLNGKNATCYPGFENELFGANFCEQKVVTDGNIITACGVGAAFEFGFEILKHLTDSQKSQEIKKTMKY